jgi:hypothetical protein
MDDVAEAVPSPRPRRLVYGAGLVGAGLVAGVVLAGLNVATAQTSPSPVPSTSAAPDPGPGGPGGPGRPGRPGPFGRQFGRRGPGGPDGPGRELPGALHGEFTTKAPSGGYQVMAMQVGDATAVSATSITVKSEDGYSRTYAVTDDTLVNAGNVGIGDVKTGDKVRVLALVKDGNASAVHVMDVTSVRALRDKWAPRRPEPSPSAAT